MNSPRMMFGSAWVKMGSVFTDGSRRKATHIDIASLEREWGYRVTRFDEYLNTVKLAPAA